ncbi:hypothetical protein GYMLUDRAFT_91402 [Collybiopsis luxurians FD-317 M1]|nr:hypothetical protein GYMLUDRAFT_91402 [Collybiopsis luxurians FD-317 M1]
MLATVSVLGKRRASVSASSSYVLHLNSSPEPAIELPSKKPIIINGKLTSGNTKKRYQCTFAGCEKAYTKPSRLVEHTRSHTGERPFVCSTCQKSYFRESHLQAHARSHLPASDKSLACTLPNCHKRFWTRQHLRRHVDWHNGLLPFSCAEPDCDEFFAKHHQLRTHLATVHAPAGTKPYRCTYTGCTKSFETNQKLRTHARTHNEKRYTCVHVNCLPTLERSIVFYPTWSALQQHTRTAHPPTCTHPSCNGRVFSTAGNLRAHLKLHAERDEEAQLNAILAQTDEEGEPPKKRRRGGEYGRDWKCPVESCGKDFKSNKALTVHHKVTHLGRRDFVCTHDDCGASFGYKHLLQRHFARAHSKQSDNEGTEAPTDSCSGEGSGSESESDAPALKTTLSMDIASITGASYSARAKELLSEAKAIRCPFPQLHTHKIKFVDVVTTDEDEDTRSKNPTSEFVSDVAGTESVGPNCEFVFRRGYDLRRHLRAVHKIEAEKESVDRWVKMMKG